MLRSVFLKRGLQIYVFIENKFISVIFSRTHENGRRSSVISIANNIRIPVRAVDFSLL